MSKHETSVTHAEENHRIQRTARMLRAVSRASGVLMYLCAAAIFAVNVVFWYGAAGSSGMPAPPSGASAVATVANSVWQIAGAIAMAALSATFAWNMWALLWFFTAYFASVLETRMEARGQSSTGVEAQAE